MQPTGDAQARGRAPRSRTCYICGRQYGTASYEIHLKQCRQLWEAREALKEPALRKPVPTDPLEAMASGLKFVSGHTSEPSQKHSQGHGPEKGQRQGQGQGSSQPKPSPRVGSGGGGGGGGVMSLEEMNRLAAEAFNNAALERCAFCGRTFLPEKLVIHNRSCTQDKPARAVSDPVNRRPATSAGRLGDVTDEAIPMSPPRSKRERRVRRPLAQSIDAAAAAAAADTDEEGGIGDARSKGERSISPLPVRSRTPKAGHLSGLPRKEKDRVVEPVSDAHGEDSDRERVRAALDRLEYLEQLAGRIAAEIGVIRKTLEPLS